MVDVINIAADRQKFMTLTSELSWQRSISRSMDIGRKSQF